jgi:hypothetical protein
MGDQQEGDARRMAKLSWDQVIAFRLERQFLRSRAPAGSLFEVASALCGVRAQLPSTAELALWARVDDLEHGEVTQALEKDRTLVKTRARIRRLRRHECGRWSYSRAGKRARLG